MCTFILKCIISGTCIVVMTIANKRILNINTLYCESIALLRNFICLIRSLENVFWTLMLWFCYFLYSHNTEKVIYFLLLERKKRRPANEDDTVAVKNTKNSFDPPKKRVDTCKMIDDIDSNFSQISAGSPATPRKQMLQ